MRRFAAWLFSDWRLAIVAPLIVAAVFITCCCGSSFVTAVERYLLIAEHERNQAKVDREVREMPVLHERVRLVDAVLAWK